MSSFENGEEEEEELEEEILSPSNSSDSGDDYALDREEDLEVDDGQRPVARNPSDEDRKSKNVDALVRGNLIVRRQALLPRVLSVTEGASICRKPFKPPCSNGYKDGNEKLTRRLCARKRFVPWGSSRPVLVAITDRINVSSTVEKDKVEESVILPPGIDPLLLWQPEDSEDAASNSAPIVVDPLLVQFLRPHQREGVQFMFECVSGLHSAANINGCILADDMGLGKTLQSITLLYTLLGQGFDGKPMVKKAIIVTPTSLVSNWEAEIKKWVGERVKLIALCENSRDDVVSGLDSFTGPRSTLQVLIVSYETFRMHSSKFSHSESCDLLICDEAHRLKNDQTLTNRALAALSCKRRILLSGTPMQNDLEEFFAMVNFTNPGILGDAMYFRRHYETPIISGREPTATEEEKRLGVERAGELSAKVNQFILRRTNALLSNHLPPKIIEVVCCKLTPLQSELYNHFIHSKNVKRAINEDTKQSKILAYITALKKLCNHPKTLDLFAQLCRERRYPYVRLDGTTSIGKRQKLVNRFNDPAKDEFVFLLSSKAGGCGLNLIGGNRLVLFDPDWNPANDKQAAARVWRDGQKKRVYIYRFLSTGTIEEKVYQRQMSKEGLQKVIQHEQNDSLVSQGNFLSTEDLRDLFSFHENVRSEIHENMDCARCLFHDDGPRNIIEGEGSISRCQSEQDVSDIGGFAGIAGVLRKLRSSEKQVGTPLEEDLVSWGHHFNASSVPDAILQVSAGDEVTFVFTNQVDGKLVPIESTPTPKMQEIEGNQKEHDNKENLDRNLNLFQHQKSPQPPLPNGDSVRVPLSASLKPLLRTTVKRMRTPLKEAENAALKSKRTLGNQLPLKRLSPYTVEFDNDFE
ncbi:protein CHROMATIN REMODELING 25 isoform X2 [Manihot esculenta]|uniref:protein CHROMATIN REMODELING 25 isoform X2 n=1 Tax=Manihot esculenta TaxID=3983 RepID=UPI000B5D53EB|nr:protein CHROMATIN REMODELING 25 isoform X2 [Manihot esculenta]